MLLHIFSKQVIKKALQLYMRYIRDDFRFDMIYNNKNKAQSIQSIWEWGVPRPMSVRFAISWHNRDRQIICISINNAKIQIALKSEKSLNIILMAIFCVDKCYIWISCVIFFLKIAFIGREVKHKLKLVLYEYFELLVFFSLFISSFLLKYLILFVNISVWYKTVFIRSNAMSFHTKQYHYITYYQYNIKSWYNII